MHTGTQSREGEQCPPHGAASPYRSAGPGYAASCHGAEERPGGWGIKHDRSILMQTTAHYPQTSVCHLGYGITTGLPGRKYFAEWKPSPCSPSTFSLGWNSSIGSRTPACGNLWSRAGHRWSAGRGGKQDQPNAGSWHFNLWLFMCMSSNESFIRAVTIFKTHLNDRKKWLCVIFWVLQDVVCRDKGHRMSSDTNQLLYEAIKIYKNFGFEKYFLWRRQPQATLWTDLPLLYRSDTNHWITIFHL